MTWLYVPSTVSRSAREVEGSILPSSWQSHVLAQSCWWRGKHSPSATWSKRCEKVSWLRLLCGVMSEPSTADAGVGLWMASLAGFRANRTAWLGESKAASINATYGAPRAGLSSKAVRGSSSLKTLPECSRRGLTKSLEPSGFGETFASLVSRLRSDCSQRQKSARRMSASASSFSPWPTPAVTDSNGARNRTSGRTNPDSRHHDGVTLNDAIVLWQASAWPTPTANDWKGSGPTIVRSDGKMRGDRLDYATEQMWSTPRASDGEKGGPNQPFGAGGDPLPAQAVSFRQAHPIYPAGGNFSNERRSLNPLFVEWLMGWPPGWTLLAWTDFACSETALFRWKQRMRSALSSLDSPREAPPAQLSLLE